METDKELELIYEKNYINRRVYGTTLSFSDGFKATIMKEFKDKDCKLDRFIRAINFLIIKELEDSKNKTEKAPEVKPIKGKVEQPPRPLETKVASSPQTPNREA